MAPIPSTQTPGVASPNRFPQPFDDLADKAENGYASMPLTPKATPGFSTEEKRTGMARFAVKSVHMRECFAEFLGTFVMIVFGMGVNNQVTNSKEAMARGSASTCAGVSVCSSASTAPRESAEPTSIRP
ncbi:hypothetical protein DVH05_025249 [Phytophthora capsici]|nr:hypothetical protein DVH05_025249 [Phytophthora capsici]